MSNAEPRPCVATSVTADALKLIRDAGNEGGRYRATHPWLIAAEHFRTATAAGKRMGLVFYNLDLGGFTDWTFLRDIDVVEFHRGSWETRCAFDPLRPVPEIWFELDSICLQPSAEQLRREALEPIGLSRIACQLGDLSPYALCEPPPFMVA